MIHTFHYTIGTEAGRTVGQFLSNQGYSRHLIIRLKRSPKGICINGIHAYTTQILAAFDHLTIRLEESRHSELIVPAAMPLEIVYEDSHLMVINKAANVPVHPSQGNFDCTLANGVAHYFKEQGVPFVFRVVNRLDRDTTGLLILAKHGLSSCILSKQMREHRITRTYLAVVSGLLGPGTKGTITAPIARSESSAIERCVDYERGESAATHYRSLACNKELNCSLIRLRLETGRTHQIRVHMKSAGYPLLGDFLYNPDYRLFQRQSLHSWKLEFEHPITGVPLSFTAPVPDDFPVALRPD